MSTEIPVVGSLNVVSSRFHPFGTNSLNALLGSVNVSASADAMIVVATANNTAR
jgi:hypothetical protein